MAGHSYCRHARGRGLEHVCYCSIFFWITAAEVTRSYNAIRLAKPDIHDRDALQVSFANENERFVEEQNRV